MLPYSLNIQKQRINQYRPMSLLSSFLINYFFIYYTLNQSISYFWSSAPHTKCQSKIASWGLWDKRRAVKFLNIWGVLGVKKLKKIGWVIFIDKQPLYHSTNLFCDKFQLSAVALSTFGSLTLCFFLFWLVNKILMFVLRFGYNSLEIYNR